jgi:hypothetical protein
MNLSPADLSTMRQALVDLRTQIEETGPCDHPVNICVCGLRTTYKNLGSLFYRITDGQVGFVPEPQFIDLEQMTRNILGIKPDADTANTAFRKGTIND